jgi:hypothetical protein
LGSHYRETLKKETGGIRTWEYLPRHPVMINQNENYFPMPRED